MADKAIGELIAATSVTPTDLFVLEQNGTPKKLTGQVLGNWLVSFADGHGGIQNIEKVSTSGLKDTYRITLADTTTFDFIVTNGKSISSVKQTSVSGLTRTYTIAFNDGSSQTFTVTDGRAITSVKQTDVSGLTRTYTIEFNSGDPQTFTVTDGRGITSIRQTDANGLTRTYTIAMNDGTSETFTITDGRSITDIVKTSTNVLTDTYTISYNDDTQSTFAVKNGRGILSFEKVSTVDLVDTYRIEYNDGTADEFTVTNGAKGDKGDNTYTHIKFASQEPTEASHSMGDVPDDWIGIYYGALSAAPTDWKQYAWFKIKGEKGDTGDPATLVSATVTYQVGDSGTIIPSGTWGTSIPVVAQGKYLWIRKVTHFNTGNPITEYSVTRMGLDGLGSVVSVAGVSPDANGNVPLSASDVKALPIGGGDMEGPINMNGQPISGLNVPTTNDQVANKGYVDTAFSQAFPISGGEMGGWIDFGKATRGLKWTTANGTEIMLRPYGNLLQFVIKPSGGTSKNAFGIKSDGTISTDFPIPIAAGGTNAKDATTARTNLGIIPRRYVAIGEILTSQGGGTARGYGQATIHITPDGVARIDFACKITADGTLSDAFAVGIDPAVLKAINANIPTITPTTGGTWIRYDAAGNVALARMNYGAIINQSASYSAWILSRVYNTSGAYGAWGDNSYKIDDYITGTCYGTVTL